MIRSHFGSCHFCIIAAANSSDFAAAMSHLALFHGEWTSDVKRFVRGIDALQTSRVTQCLLAHMLLPSTFQPIKGLSHFGANVSRQGFPLDSGNIAYSLVFVALDAVAPVPREYESEPQSELVVRTPVSLCELLGALRARWPTLEPSACSKEAYARKGDIIECMLAMWRLDHAEVFPADYTKEERRAWLEDIEAACGCARRLLSVGGPLNKHNPPLMLLEQISMAHAAHHMQFPPSYTGRRKFQARCAAFGDAMQAIAMPAP